MQEIQKILGKLKADHVSLTEQSEGETKMDQDFACYIIGCMKKCSIIRKAQIIKELSPKLIISLRDETDLAELGILTKKERDYLRDILSERNCREKYLSELEKCNARFIGYFSPDYPPKLKQLPDSPAGLFVIGSLPEENSVCVAIVGARACSSYGKTSAKWLSESLAGAGISIISGMANGIDQAAQSAAVGKKGGSFAVLAGGPDICYPKENIELYKKLANTENSGILSEMPPGTVSLPYLFVQRNLIISGLSEAVIVVQARDQSGSLITADYAADQGRLVYAVPGDIRSSLSHGCHKLIRGGAILLSEPSQLMEDLRMPLEASADKEFSIGKKELDDEENDIYDILSNIPRHIEELLEETGYPIGNLSKALLLLELWGYAEQSPKNYYRKTNPIPPGK